MYRWLLLASVLAVSLAEESASDAKAEAPDSKAEESHHDKQERRWTDYGEDLPGTGVLREIHPSGYQLPKHRIEEQNRIVYDRYSPNYYQPQWILDYRYLKTGGRDYTRSEGGQILILPKGMKAPHDENKKFKNYDELLEFLRLKELHEREELERRRKGHHYDHDDYRGEKHHSYRPEEKESWEREAFHGNK